MWFARSFADKPLATSRWLIDLNTSSLVPAGLSIPPSILISFHYPAWEHSLRRWTVDTRNTSRDSSYALGLQDSSDDWTPLDFLGSGCIGTFESDALENVGFLGVGKAGVPRRKTSRSRVENQQTQPAYDGESGNWTRATFVGDECFQNYASPAPHSDKQLVSQWENFSRNKIARQVEGKVTQCNTGVTKISLNHTK